MLITKDMRQEKESYNSMDNNNLKKQSITITIGSVLTSCLHGIIGYIAAYCFKPLWEKTIRVITNKKDSSL